MIRADVSRAKRFGAWPAAGQGASISSMDVHLGIQPVRQRRRAGRMIGACASKVRCFARETDHRTVGQGSGKAPLASCGKREGL